MMYFLSAIFLGITAAVPFDTLEVPRATAPSDIKVIGITATGTGCPPGHASINVDATGTIFDVAFDQYIVAAGPGAGTNDSRKNCRVSINLQFSSGWQFSVVESRFQGYASLASGQTGTCRASYTFSGDPGQEVVFQKSIAAPYEDNYNMLAGVGLESWSKCGGSTAILNVNSEIRITPLTTPNRGAMTVDSFDGNVHVVSRTNWRRC